MEIVEMIAKYRKDGHPGEWWITDFTIEQVEGRIEYLEKRTRQDKMIIQKYEKALIEIRNESYSVIAEYIVDNVLNKKKED
jgi:hypothetical protein